MRGAFGGIAALALLVAAGFAAAQEDGPTPTPSPGPKASPQPCRTDGDGGDGGEGGKANGTRERCVEAYCANPPPEHADACRLREACGHEPDEASARRCVARWCEEHPGAEPCPPPTPTARPTPSPHPDPSCAFDGSGCRPPKETEDDGDDDRPRDGRRDRHEERREKIRQAVEHRHVGAEVFLRSRLVAGDGAVKVQAYDGLQVHVDAPDGKATRDRPIRVQVSADLEEGRTVVIDLDGSVLRGDRLELRYFDVHDDLSETEVVFLRADGLEDVLDPTNDGGQPEYWFVADEDGLQLLASIPHWSTHAITIASLRNTAPSILVGAAAGVAGAVVAAAVLLRPRRPGDGD